MVWNWQFFVMECSVRIVQEDYEAHGQESFASLCRFAVKKYSRSWYCRKDRITIETYIALECYSISLLCYCEVQNRNTQHEFYHIISFGILVSFPGLWPLVSRVNSEYLVPGWDCDATSVWWYRLLYLVHCTDPLKPFLTLADKGKYEKPYTVYVSRIDDYCPSTVPVQTGLRWPCGMHDRQRSVMQDRRLHGISKIRLETFTLDM